MVAWLFLKGDFMMQMTLDGVKELSRVELEARLSALLAVVEDSEHGVEDIEYALMPGAESFQMF